jgi:hypothetical protein
MNYVTQYEQENEADFQLFMSQWYTAYDALEKLKAEHECTMDLKTYCNGCAEVAKLENNLFN